MKKLLNNPEVYKNFLLQSVCSGVGIALAFGINRQAGILVICICALFLLVYMVSTFRRYEKISRLAADVNKILHGDNSISLENYEEGELGILHSEIYKMTVCLREQQQKLLDDKVYLADSIADISHQIRTPLTSINLLVEFLSKPDLTQERRMSLIRELYGLLSRIDWLITTLLKISRLDAGTVQFKQETAGTETLIREACAPLLVPVELRGQELAIQADGMFYGDMSWTCEALGNIIKNCMEHTKEGGKIEIIASENALFTQIIIKDNGSGIPKEDLPHIFERFYKGKDSDEKSFGVGLALARMIITSQKGTVKAENRHSEGTMFTVRFYKGTV